MNFEDVNYENEPQPRSLFWRILYGVGVVLLILILVLNLSGLSGWILNRRIAARNVVGQTEAEIINFLGEPDFRSDIQSFIPGEGFGLVPQKLDPGDAFYYLNYVVGPRIFVFHFVSPETYQKHTGQVVLGDEWVVLEHYIGSKHVIF
ncbi:MAG: hypothetical protein E4G99_11130 [Anaerolineales bacterium]|nr:MAG: hypothetical protein E4G99_11130 [Anaerolineales bacterium]